MSVTTSQGPVGAGSPPESGAIAPHRRGGGLLDPQMLWKSLPDTFLKLDPRVQIKNPIMFVV
jgi:potassium-transporting ATPase ATP-binding subunit